MARRSQEAIPDDFAMIEQQFKRLARSAFVGKAWQLAPAVPHISQERTDFAAEELKMVSSQQRFLADVSTRMLCPSLVNATCEHWKPLFL